MLFQLLEGETTGAAQNGWVSWVLIGVLLVVLVGSMFFMNRRSKKRDAEAKALIDAVKPGNKVKTIGGICGIVVEVDPDEDTFVLETGSEASGKCFMKFVRQAILESDAVVEPAATSKKGEAKAETEETAETVAETEEKAETVVADEAKDGEKASEAESKEDKGAVKE